MQGRGERFYGLDALRGVAALSVVFWHWQHFYFQGLQARKPLAIELPLHDIFSLLYARGWMAVDLFFILSGFIFFWLYAEPIARGRVLASRFLLLRFSRLYPLHLLTLLFVAGVGVDFVYAHNDMRHFGLQLLFASSWGAERGDSFNGPVWSVSVEVLVYAFFFVWCRHVRLKPRGLLLVAIFSLLVLKALYPPLGRGVGGFFLGGWLCATYQAWQHNRVASRAMAWSAASAWLATCVTHYALAWTPPKWIGSVWPVLLFGCTVLALALNEPAWRGFLKRLAWLGDISYASYLLHYPLQLLCVLAALAWGWPSGLYAQPAFLLAFMAVLIGLSLLFHHAFELPIQKRLRIAANASASVR